MTLVNILKFKDDLNRLVDYAYNFTDAIHSIVFYDCHQEWLAEIRTQCELAKENDDYVHFPDNMEWHTEKHTLWMILVGMFGDWGTSIRTGWIDRPDECIEFINLLIEEEDNEDI